MAALRALALVLFAGSLCSGYQNGKRIIGGDSTTIERYPATVQVDYLPWGTTSWSQTCGGSILNSRYILSAAHCFHSLSFLGVQYRRIRAGATYRNSGGTIAYISHVFNHPTWAMNDMDADITVLRLTAPLTIVSPTMAQANIVSQGTVIPDDTPVVYVGWGTVSYGGNYSPVLREATVLTVNRDICRHLHQELPRNQTVTENMICTLDEGGSGACHGDSGGPLYYGGILIGVVSWGEGCAQARYPGGSTRVASYTNWIVETAS